MDNQVDSLPESMVHGNNAWNIFQSMHLINTQPITERYDLVRLNRLRKGGGVACFVKDSIAYNRKPDFCINTESIFIKFFLHEPKPVLVVYINLQPNDARNF